MPWSLIESPLAGIVVGLLFSIATGWYFYRKGKSRTRLSYYSYTLSLLHKNTSPHLQDIEVSYKGLFVDELKKTWVVVWNSGNTPIRLQDIAARDPLALVCDRGGILNVITRKVVRTTNNFSIQPFKELAPEINVRFDYLDPNDGALLIVWHTGQDSDVGLVGSLIGGGPVRVSRREAAEANKQYRRLSRSKKWGMITFLFSSSFLHLSILSPTVREWISQNKVGIREPILYAFDWLSLLTGVGGIVIGSFLVSVMVTSAYPRALEFDINEPDNPTWKR